jgi:hypothetical protein
MAPRVSDGERHPTGAATETVRAAGEWSKATWATVVALVLAGLATYVIVVAFNADHINFGAGYGGGAPLARAGYCSAAGDRAVDGSPLQPGTFLDLVVGEPAHDSHYTGATPAIFVKGEGLTCGAPPAGYVRHGFAADAQHVGTGMYPYYVPAPPGVG